MDQPNNSPALSINVRPYQVLFDALIYTGVCQNIVDNKTVAQMKVEIRELTSLPTVKYINNKHMKIIGTIALHLQK